MSSENRAPSSLRGIKKLARRIQVEQKCDYHVALDLASVKAGYQNIRHASRVLEAQKAEAEKLLASKDSALVSALKSESDVLLGASDLFNLYAYGPPPEETPPWVVSQREELVQKIDFLEKAGADHSFSLLPFYKRSLAMLEHQEAIRAAGLKAIQAPEYQAFYQEQKKLRSLIAQ